MNNHLIEEDPRVLSELDTVHEENSYTDAEVLLHTRSMKLRLASALTPNSAMPTDPKEVNALMKVLDSIDRSAQTNIRNSIEQDNSEALNEALSIIAAVQKQVGNTDPFRREVDVTPEYREVTIDTQLIELDFVDGETSTELRDLTYDSFVDEFEAGQ